MTKFLSDLAAGLEPYVPGEQPKDKKYVKLNTNENPYPPSEKVLKAVESAAADLRLYPDPDATALRQAIADYYDITADNVFIGNGSDEVLAFLFPTFFKGKKVAFADITYSFYPVYCSLFEVDYELIPLTEDFRIDVDKYAGGLAADIAGVLVCNPNAPTGRALALADVERIISANPDRLVIVDEAYVDFGAETAVGLINKYDNLIVCQTFSKSRQLAGMRVGMAIACEDLIAGINAVKNCFNSYSADRIGIAAATAAMADTAYFEETRAKIMATRQRITEELEKLGFDVIPSGSNFIFAMPPAFDHAAGAGGDAGAKAGQSGAGAGASKPETDAGAMFRMLREDGVLVRYFNKPRIDNRLRITIGTDAEMDALIASVKKILNK